MKVDRRPIWPVAQARLPTTAQAAEPTAAEKQAIAAAQALAEEALSRRRRSVQLALQAYTDGAYISVLDRATGPQPLPVQVFTHADLNLKMLAHNDGGDVTLAFRGTVGPFLSAKNWHAVNLRAAQTGNPPRHGGFERAWNALRGQLLPWLALQKVESLHLVGHSMGAALAQLAALELCAAWPVRSVSLLAPPMLGTPEFNRHYEETVVAGSKRTLADLTTRYLMLSDVISVPLPRLAGYAPGEPLQVIDKHGWPVIGVPGLLDQALGQIAPSNQTQEIGKPLRGRLLPGVTPSVDLGPASMIEQTLPIWRLMVLGNGSFGGWAALAGLVAANVLWRAVGFHSMQGYDRALGPLRPRVD